MAQETGSGMSTSHEGPIENDGSTVTLSASSPPSLWQRIPQRAKMITVAAALATVSFLAGEAWVWYSSYAPLVGLPTLGAEYPLRNPTYDIQTFMLHPRLFSEGSAPRYAEETEAFSTISFSIDLSAYAKKSFPLQNCVSLQQLETTSGSSKERKVNGRANAFLLTSQGHILTNLHVVDHSPFEAPHHLEVMIDEQPYSTNLLAVSIPYDLALLKTIKAPPQGTVAAVSLRSERTLLEGETIHTVSRIRGASQSLDAVVSSGAYVSPLAMAIGGKSGEMVREAVTYTTFSQPGMSGSPEIDSYGNVVGIHFAQRLDAATVSLFGTPFIIDPSGKSYGIGASHVWDLIQFYLTSLKEQENKK